MTAVDAGRLLEVAAQRRLPVDDVLVSNEPGVPPRGPSGRWAVLPAPDGTLALGTVDRGAFRLYGTYQDEAAALNALHHVLREPVRPVPVLPEQLRALGEAAQALAARLRFSAEPLRPADVPVGTALDRLGDERGHVLFLLDTPFSERSSPPTDLELPRTRWILRAPLPATAAVSLAAPWFGQPGGGAQVVLDRPVRWYWDTGLLDAVSPREQ